MTTIEKDIKLFPRAYVYKLNPTIKQKQFFQKSFGCARFVYNGALKQKIDAYKNFKKSISTNVLSSELTKLKKSSEYSGLNEVSNKTLQYAIKNVDCAYTHFFREKKGFPKFKLKKSPKQSAQFIEHIRFDFDKGKVKIPKIGGVKLKKSRMFDLTSKIGTLTVYQDSCGTYWCSILVYDVEKQSKTKIKESTSIGIDLGLKHFAILSNGEKYNSNKYFEAKQKRLIMLQRRFSKTKSGSNRHEAARKRIAKCYNDIKNHKKDFLNKLSSKIIKMYDTICLEDLQIQKLLKNNPLSKNILNAGGSEFIRQLEYKADWYGKNIIFIGKYEPSSKKCSNCGYINSDLMLSDREWVCPSCGIKHDRDINAAINIKKIALNSI